MLANPNNHTKLIISVQQHSKCKGTRHILDNLFRKALVQTVLEYTNLDVILCITYYPYVLYFILDTRCSYILFTPF